MIRLQNVKLKEINGKIVSRTQLSSLKLVHCLQQTVLLSLHSVGTICCSGGASIFKNRTKKNMQWHFLWENFVLGWVCCLGFWGSSMPLNSPLVKKSSMNSSYICVLQFRKYREHETERTVCMYLIEYSVLLKWSFYLLHWMFTNLLSLFAALLQLLLFWSPGDDPAAPHVPFCNIY